MRDFVSNNRNAYFFFQAMFTYSCCQLGCRGRGFIFNINSLPNKQYLANRVSRTRFITITTPSFASVIFQIKNFIVVHSFW